MLDVLRSGYVRLPGSFRRLLGGAIGLLPQGVRFGRQYSRFRKEIQRARGERLFSCAAARMRLHELLSFAATHSAYYGPLLEGWGKDGGQDPLQALSALPVLDRETVRSRTADLLCKPRWAVELAASSGSSGRPVTFYLDRDRSVREWAFIHAIWARAGFRPSDYRLVVRGLPLKKGGDAPWERDSALREIRISPFHFSAGSLQQYLGLIDRFGIQFIQGYPSALETLFRYASDRGWKPVTPMRGIFPISETLYPYQRELLERVSPGVCVVPFYGLSEKAALAEEVKGEPDVYEFEPLYGWTELVDGAGRAVERRGAVGRIVGTGFISRAMPLLRYDTGDTAALVELPSEENGCRLRVSRIRSRWSQEFVVGRSGAQFSIAAINVHSAAYGCVHSFQIWQERPGEAEVLVIPRPGCGERDVVGLVREFQEKAGEELLYHLRVVESLYVNARGKQPFIRQMIPGAGTVSDS